MRKFIILALILGVLGATAYGGRKVYRHWKTQRALSAAKAALAKSDYNNAGLWLRKAVSANGNNVEAVRMMGDFTESMQAPASMFWRQRLVDLDPGSLTNRYLLARVDIALKEYPTAAKALEGISKMGDESGDFHKLTAALAIATKEFPKAEAHLQEALKLEPNNPVTQFSLATILVQRIDRQLADQGLKMLENLRTNPAVRVETLRHLTTHALRHTNYPRALALVGELVRETNSVYNDRLLHLDVLSASKDPQLSARLAGYQKGAETNAPQVFALSRWMVGSRGAPEAFAWLQSLSAATTTNLPVTLVVAETHLASRNWSGLQGYVSGQDWGELDYFRLLFRSRALREQDLGTASKADWNKALKAAEGRLDRLLALERLTAAWKWPAELEEVLWLIVNRFPTETHAQENLSTLLYLAGKTRSLLTLFAQELKRNPKDLKTMNNLASLAMLLNAEEHKPHDLTRDVYEQQPDNPGFVSTYAYSLHLQNKTREALKVMDKLKPEQLEVPGIAGYYGVILAASGDTTRAKKYLDIATKSRVLPEEAQLFQRVKL